MLSGEIEKLVDTESSRISRALQDHFGGFVSEEDVRHECNTLLEQFIEAAGLNIQGRHEYGLAGGQIDSKYASVIIEYKNPNGGDRITGNVDSHGARSVIRQISRRFLDFQRVEGIEPEKLFGVGTDGQNFIFVRRRGGKIDVDGPHTVSDQVISRLLRALVSLGARGESFTSTNLSRDFGARSIVAQQGVRQLYLSLIDSRRPKVDTLFRQWTILFSEVSGRELDASDARLADLTANYGLDDSDSRKLLFALHTYYALLMKFIAGEIVSGLGPLFASPVRKCFSAPSSTALKRELLHIEEGGIWGQLGIKNFLEGDLFSWYLDAWDERVAGVVRSVLRTLDEYDPGTLGMASDSSHDLLKGLYQHLFPRSVRRNLGEYYTPDWLVNLTLDEVGYDGNPDIRVLDPACGSGSFIVGVVERAKRWFLDHRHECGYEESGLLKRLTSNIVGFDLNPLAVMASRTNFLLAIRDLVRYSEGLELPVYLCDSVVTPAEYADLFVGGYGKGKRLRTAVADFVIPSEVTGSPQVLGRYSDLLDFCVRHEYTPEEFVDRCITDMLPVSDRRLHVELYEQLLALAASDQDGIWARIIKNAFAPLFIGRVDYVVGNPPWINWAELPEEYRRDSEHIWRAYDLLTLAGWKAKVAAGRVDLSILFIVIAMETYLKEAGRLGFVITQSVFKSTGGGEGFRRFLAKDVKFAPLRVHDFSQLTIFDDATNRAALAIFVRDSEIKYPVPYFMWHPVTNVGTIPSTTRLDQLGLFCQPEEQIAIPSIESNPLSPWLTGSSNTVRALGKILGSNGYRANWGCALSVFQLEETKSLGQGLCWIKNDAGSGRQKVEARAAAVEEELVYTLLKGRNVRRWVAEPRLRLLMTHAPSDPKHAISVSDLKRSFPKAYSYLFGFKKDLESRKEYKRWGGVGPFYELYRIGPYTFAPFKVVFKDLTELFQCAVVEFDNEGKPIIPDYTLRLIPFEDEEEAYFLAGVLNSAPSVLALHATSVGVQTQRYHAGDLDKLNIPRFSKREKVHEKISAQSRLCHEVARVDSSKLKGLEVRLDELVAEMWNLSRSEMDEIWRVVKELDGENDAGE